MSLPIKGTGSSHNQADSISASGTSDQKQPTGLGGRTLSLQSPQENLVSSTQSDESCGSGDSQASPATRPLRGVKKTPPKQKKPTKLTPARAARQRFTSSKRRKGEFEQIDILRELVTPRYIPAIFDFEKEIKKLKNQGLSYGLEDMTEFEKKTLFIERPTPKKELSQPDVILFTIEALKRYDKALKCYETAVQSGLDKGHFSGAGQTPEPHFYHASLFERQDFCLLANGKLRRLANGEAFDSVSPPVNLLMRGELVAAFIRRESAQKSLRPSSNPLPTMMEQTPAISAQAKGKHRAPPVSTPPELNSLSTPDMPKQHTLPLKTATEGFNDNFIDRFLYDLATSNHDISTPKSDEQLSLLSAAPSDDSD
ncbi:hypothetical protein [Sansalvadorimonas verongulae]|uniref:hypothetical protein n=1 Tax=Sansalvadorimonas verongulae TaxID=2172824 RepID=UPI0012BBEF36|nr:hypothetical protein [Sansalvadorimonas verongulae]MTI15162.1 hypothetical protein [Sansalvadorimonas verongulae]